MLGGDRLASTFTATADGGDATLLRDGGRTLARALDAIGVPS